MVDGQRLAEVNVHQRSWENRDYVIEKYVYTYCFTSENHNTMLWQIKNDY